MLTSDEVAVLRRLEAWVTRFTRIEALFDARRGALPDARLAEAHELYTRLKRDLEAEYQSTSQNQRRPPLNEAEQQWYAQTIDDANFHLVLEEGAPPEAWLWSLFEARQDFEYAILELRRWQDRIAGPGERLPVACPHCTTDLQASKYFEYWSAPAGGPRVDQPFWTARCSGCGRRFSYVPSNCLLLEHRAVILTFYPRQPRVSAYSS